MTPSSKIDDEIDRLMRDPNALRSEPSLTPQSDGRDHYDPKQPRVPAGDPRGGQWTSGGANAEQVSTKDSALSSSAPSKERMHTAQWTGSGGSPTSRDDRPIYDAYDSALVHPKGLSTIGGVQTLQYEFDDGHYLGGVTVTNADRTIVGRLLHSMNRGVIHLQLDAQIYVADGGVSRHSFEIKENLSSGSSTTIPWKEFGLMRGPGRVVITVRNLGTQSAGVVIGAVKITNRQ